jgi:hypothetical protein
VLSCAEGRCSSEKDDWISKLSVQEKSEAKLFRVKESPKKKSSKIETVLRDLILLE